MVREVRAHIYRQHGTQLTGPGAQQVCLISKLMAFIKSSWWHMHGSGMPSGTIIGEDESLHKSHLEANKILPCLSEDMALKFTGFIEPLMIDT